MSRAWIWGLLLVMACAEKAPPEGAVRVEVRYVSYAPACVRVLADDSQGHQKSTSILQSKFKDAEGRLLRFAVFREADWARELSVEVSSYRSAEGDACAGEPLETFTEKVAVPLGNFATVAVALRATDVDSDGFPALEGSVAGLDCDDERADIYPGAPEGCAVGVDFDCNGLRGCQDGKCQQKACDDGNPCTTGEVCAGSGTTAQCQGGQAVVCPRSSSACVTKATCVRETGKCVDERKTCNSPSACQEAGTCNDATGNCEYPAKPATTLCDDGQVCTSGDTCNAAGTCTGTPSTCTASSVCMRVKGGTCSAAGDCTEEPDSTKADTACSVAGDALGRKCRATGQCSRFPYAPSYFDPDDIPAARIVNLTTTCDVTFDSASLAWSPANCVMNSPIPIELTQETGVVLLPISNLSLGANLKLVGNRPVIFAVFNNATLDHAVISRGVGTTAPGAGGSVALACDRRRGRGGVSEAVSGGGGGAGGGLGGADGGKSSPPASSPGEGGDAETLLAGGCSGGSGGGAFGGRGGLGGGMIQLSVAGTLTVKGTLSVSGGGGGGGTTSADGAAGGGGGGGSGGRLLLEAQQVTVDNMAHLTANGGGGGEGGAYQNAGDRTTGANGADGSEGYVNGAMGGMTTGSQGGNGGTGGGRDTLAGMGKDGMPGGGKGGGGGGGGAVGVIRVRSLKPCSLNSPYISPNPTAPQCSL